MSSVQSASIGAFHIIITVDRKQLTDNYGGKRQEKFLDGPMYVLKNTTPILKGNLTLAFTYLKLPVK